MSRGERTERRHVEQALAHERAFVLALGGYAVELPGAHLVVHERLPVPRLNFVQVTDVPPTRQAAFFERALDHYFQRAIRPAFRVPVPAPAHLDKGLRRFGFVPREEPHEILEARSVHSAAGAPYLVRPAGPDELDLVVGFWGTAGTREEFRRTLEVLWNFPHSEESLEPLLTFRPDGTPASAALLYRNHGVTGIHAVATQPEKRGAGAASALVQAACERPIARGSELVLLSVDQRRGSARLATLGFRVLVEEVEYALAPGAQLALPPLGPPGPPRWRPPRNSNRPR